MLPHYGDDLYWLDGELAFSAAQRIISEGELSEEQMRKYHVLLDKAEDLSD